MIMNMNPQPDAYAGWLFRSGAQDGPSDAHKVLRVVSLGNNWYQYTFLDMGIKCTNKVKVIKVGNKLMFDEIEQGKNIKLRVSSELPSPSFLEGLGAWERSLSSSLQTQ